MKKIVLLLFFVQLAFAQKNTSSEAEIYAALDAFIADPTLSGIKKLELAEQYFWKNPKSKSKNEKLSIVILNCNKAFYQKQFGQYFEAIHSYEKALSLFQKNQLSDYDIIEYCLKPLGNLYTMTGDYTSAENTIKHYLYLAVKNDDLQQKISAIINLAAVYKSIGKNDEAIILLENAYATNTFSKEKEALLLLLIGENYLAKQEDEKALKAFEKAAMIAPSATLYKNLATTYRHLRKYKIAEDYIKKAKLSLSDASKRAVSQLYLEEAKLYLDQKKIGESQIAIQKIFRELIPSYNPKSVLPAQKMLYPENLLIDALDVLAMTYEAQKKYQKAIDCYKLTFAIDAQFATFLFYEDTSLVHSADIRNRVEKAIGMYEKCFQEKNDRTFLEQAFALQETTKSSTLKNYITLTKKSGNKSQKAILYKIHELSNIVIKEQEKREKANLEIINNALKLQNETIIALKKSFEKNKLDRKSQLDFDRLYHQLKTDDATLTAYFYGKEKVYVFDLYNSQIQLSSFAASPSNKKIITDYLDYFGESAAISNNIAGYKQQSHKLYKLLLLKKINTKKHLILPDGLLCFISFESLLTQTSQSTDFSKLPYLMKEEIISYATSVDFYMNNTKPSYKNQSVLGVFPVFENSNRNLSFSVEELKSIKQLYGGIYLEKNQASYANFLKDIRNHSILHLSTHASSGNTKTPAAISFYDQEVLYGDLYSLDIHPDLVVLSACETGIGKLYRGEGALSIARGFQNAGAENLLFSLWKVNDYTTSVMMKKFYENCEKGETYFRANYQAKMDFLNDKGIPNSKKSPYFWSAFVFYGDISEDASCNYWYLLGGFAIIIFCLAIAQKQKSSK